MRNFIDLVEGAPLLVKEISLKDGVMAKLVATRKSSGISVDVTSAEDYCGGVLFGKNDWYQGLEGTWSAMDAHVNAEWRRKGVASAIYDAMEELGHTVVPEPRHNKRTSDADAFWKSRISESIIVGKPSEASMHGFFEDASEMLGFMVSEYRSGQHPHHPWTVVSAARLTRIWKDAARTGFVRDEKGLAAIAGQFYKNIVRLHVNTEVSGHFEGEPDLDEYFEDDEKDAFIDWAIETADGPWRISDYGWPRLRELACLIKDAGSAEDLLQVCDAILNVTHQRSDMASWFVEGGTKTLDAISA